MAPLLALYSAAMWVAWLSWGNHKSYDPLQVVACGLFVAAGSAIAMTRVRPRRTESALGLAAAADIGFAVPWGWDASSDETGLWVAGLLLLLVGVGTGLSILLTAVVALSCGEKNPKKGYIVCAVLAAICLIFPPAILIPIVAATVIRIRSTSSQR